LYDCPMLEGRHWIGNKMITLSLHDPLAVDICAGSDIKVSSLRSLLLKSLMDSSGRLTSVQLLFSGYDILLVDGLSFELTPGVYDHR
jgi:hypothetical protein